MSVAVRLMDGGRGLDPGSRWEIRGMLGACLRGPHGSVGGVVQDCTSMQSRGRQGLSCDFGLSRACGRGKRETTELAAEVRPVLSQGFAPLAALVVDGDARVQETLRAALEALGVSMTFEQRPDAAL